MNLLGNFARVFSCFVLLLMVRYRYNAWQKRYHAASTAMENRAEQIAAVAVELECELQLIGASAIEDKLQVGFALNGVVLLRCLLIGLHETNRKESQKPLQTWPALVSRFGCLPVTKRTRQSTLAFRAACCFPRTHSL